MGIQSFNFVCDQKKGIWRLAFDNEGRTMASPKSKTQIASHKKTLLKQSCNKAESEYKSIK